MVKKADPSARGLPRDFAGLCAMHPPRPIRSRGEVQAAVEMIDRLTSVARPTRDQADYLETLTTLVEAHEADIELGPDIRGLEALRALMAANGMTPTDLSRLLGDESRSIGSRILSGRRELSKAHIRTLSEHFAVSADLFV